MSSIDIFVVKRGGWVSGCSQPTRSSIGAHLGCSNRQHVRGWSSGSRCCDNLFCSKKEKKISQRFLFFIVTIFFIPSPSFAFLSSLASFPPNTFFHPCFSCVVILLYKTHKMETSIKSCHRRKQTKKIQKKNLVY